jgi:molecular chaperone DnaK (HSP70)
MSLSNNNSEYLAIDFGTCNSVISLIQNSNTNSVNSIQHILDDFSGDVLIPTTIYFYKDEIDENLSINDFVYTKHYIIGHGANEALSNQKIYENYFYQFKRFLGITSKSIDQNKDFLNKFNLEYTTDSDTIFFYLTCFDNPELKIKISIIDLIKLFFQALNQMIKLKLNIIGQINCVITCPAYFHDLQRTQLKKASEDAGFIVNKI